MRDQYLMLVHDEAAAVAALPSLLRGHEAQAAEAFEIVERVVTAAGPLTPEGEDRLGRMAELFGTAGRSKRRTDRRRLSVAGGSQVSEG